MNTWEKSKLSMCTVLAKEVEFLGQWVTPYGSAPKKEKMKAIVAWETPKDMKGVRSFSGIANYYRHFVPKYVELVAPLTYLTKKEV